MLAISINSIFTVGSKHSIINLLHVDKPLAKHQSQHGVTKSLDKGSQGCKKQ